MLHKMLRSHSAVWSTLKQSIEALIYHFELPATKHVTYHVTFYILLLCRSTMQQSMGALVQHLKLPFAHHSA
jgi:hypothetical protein